MWYFTCSGVEFIILLTMWANTVTSITSMDMSWYWFCWSLRKMVSFGLLIDLAVLKSYKPISKKLRIMSIRSKPPNRWESKLFPKNRRFLIRLFRKKKRKTIHLATADFHQVIGWLLERVSRGSNIATDLSVSRASLKGLLLIAKLYWILQVSSLKNSYQIC